MEIQKMITSSIGLRMPRNKSEKRLVYQIPIFILVLSSSLLPIVSTYTHPCDAARSQNPLFVDELPKQSVTIIFDGNLFGTRINMSLTYGFSESSPDGIIMVGVIANPLVVDNGFFASPILGIGYAEMREYSYIYANGSSVTDYWTPHDPGWISRRNYPAWTQTSTPIGLFTGHGNFSDSSLIDYAGTILEFENLTVYFQDGTNSSIGPRIITIGANFTQTSGIWNSNAIFYTSDNNTVVLDESQFTISDLTTVPLDLSLIVLSIIVGTVAIIVIINILKREDVNLSSLRIV